MEALFRKISVGNRVTFQELLELYHGATLPELGTLANAIRLRKHPEPEVTFVVDRNINYTNVCSSECKFCAFYSKVGEEGGYVLSREAFSQKMIPFFFRASIFSGRSITPPHVSAITRSS